MAVLVASVEQVVPLVKAETPAAVVLAELVALVVLLATVAKEVPAETAETAALQDSVA